MSPRVLASPMHPTQTPSGNSSTRHGSMSALGSTGGSSTHGGGGSVTKSPRTPIIPQQHAKAGTRRNTTYIGKTVRINQGPYKGYVGIVKDATDATARVELHTKCQTINVDLNRLTIQEYAKINLNSILILIFFYSYFIFKSIENFYSNTWWFICYSDSKYWFSDTDGRTWI